VVNVLGFETANVFEMPVDSENVNRVFPGDPSGPPSHVLAHFIFESVRRVADVAIDLHGGNSSQALITPFSVYCETGEVEVDRRSAELARRLDAPFMWAIDAQRGGAMLTSALNRHGIAAAISEAGDLGTCREEDVRAHLRGVANVLKLFGAIDGSPEQSYPSPEVFRRDFYAFAHTAGIFDALPPVDARVNAGDLIGAVKNLAGDTVEEIRSPYAGVLISRQSARVVHSGSRLYHGITS
jgi:predicted deacylase